MILSRVLSVISCTETRVFVISVLRTWLLYYFVCCTKNHQGLISMNYSWWNIYFSIHNTVCIVGQAYLHSIVCMQCDFHYENMSACKTTSLWSLYFLTRQFPYVVVLISTMHFPPYHNWKRINCYDSEHTYCCEWSHAQYMECTFGILNIYMVSLAIWIKR